MVGELRSESARVLEEGLDSAVVRCQRLSVVAKEIQRHFGLVAGESFHIGCV